MGNLCSVGERVAGLRTGEADSQTKPRPIHITKMPPSWMTEKLARQKMNQFMGDKALASLESYEDARNLVLRKEQAMAFDAVAQQQATPLEKEAARIVRAIRASDVEQVWTVQTDHQGDHRRPAGHFLGTVDIINQTELLKVAKAFPKGAHLHCHFNSCLPPEFLISHARNVPNMWLKSSQSLATKEGRENAELQFQVQIDPHLQNPALPEGNLLAPDYPTWAWMRYSDFRVAFGGDDVTEAWLSSKMLLNEPEVYGLKQSVANIWLRFDICTRMMKGLFGYESAFRSYTRACIEDFVKDKIQYAEIRPNFPSNVLRCDNGIDTIDNRGMMRIIIAEIQRQRAVNPEADFGGLKVIYCCPRSFSNEKIKDSLIECIQLKEEFPDLMCGYDLVGSEDRGHPLKKFLPELLWFQSECTQKNLTIPFLFHAGETLDTGTTTDQNLIDAVLLNSKRIGHGFALSRHPEVLEMIKSRGICLETCPISNEILHLTSTIKGHVLPDLLARNVHCTVNSDNGTFYSSTLSHDFYQVMVGSNSMDTIGWKVLAQWSLEHSCMSPAHRSAVEKVWDKEWDKFCHWVVDTYGERFPATVAS